MSERCTVADCVNEQRLDELEKNDDRVAETLKSLDIKLDTVITRLGRIEVLETAHNYQTEAVSRAHKRIDELKVANEAVLKFQHTTEGMSRIAWAVWSALGASVFMLFVKVLFFMGAHGGTL